MSTENEKKSLPLPVDVRASDRDGRRRARELPVGAYIDTGHNDRLDDLARAVVDAIWDDGEQLRRLFLKHEDERTVLVPKVYNTDGRAAEGADRKQLAHGSSGRNREDSELHLCTNCISSQSRLTFRERCVILTRGDSEVMLVWGEWVTLMKELGAVIRA